MSFERASINFLEMIIEQAVFQSIPPRRTQLAPAFADALADEGWDAAQYYSAEGEGLAAVLLDPAKIM